MIDIFVIFHEIKKSASPLNEENYNQFFNRITKIDCFGLQIFEETSAIFFQGIQINL